MSSMGPLLLTDEGAWKKNVVHRQHLQSWPCTVETAPTALASSWPTGNKPNSIFFLTHHMTEGNL